jgi:hypothetical protein
MAPDSLLRALRHVWLTLEPLGLPMAVMGGLALATWKHVRATRDIDLLLGAREDDPQDLLKVLGAAGIRPKRSPARVRLGQLELLQLLYEPPETFIDLQVDLLLAKSDYHRRALDRRVPTRLPDLDIEIAVLACEDLVLHKLLAGRVIDVADTAALLRANRDSLDIPYLMNWAEELHLVSAFRQAWQTVWPDEPPGGHRL